MSEATERLERVAAHLSRLDAVGFSGAVGIVQQGRVQLSRGLGFANLAEQQRFKSSTPFFVASLSKQFTAAIILALESRGRLNVSDTIGTYFADVPRAMSSVTIRHLLTHTSGLVKLDESGGSPTSGVEVARAAFRAGTDFAPGSRFDYSNAGYALLAAIAEKVGGKSYEELMRELVFAPAGMLESNIVTEGPSAGAEASAIGYNGFIPQGPAYLRRAYGREFLGPAGVVTTLSDMLRWELALRDGRVIPDASLQSMFTPDLENYGYGWGIWRSSRAGERVAAHDGHIMPEGFNAYYVRLLESDAAVIVFANRGDFSLAERVAWEIVDILSGGAAPPLPEPTVVAGVRPRPGLYVAPNGARLLIHLTAGHSYLEPMNQEAANLFIEDSAAATRCAERATEWLDDEAVRATGPIGATLATARAQSVRFGDYRGHEVVYCVPEEGFTRAHLRHFVGSDTIFTRVDVRDTAVLGGTDSGAFVSKGRGLTPSLARLALVSVGPGAWVIYDLRGGNQVQAALTSGRLTIGAANRQLTFVPDSAR